MTMIYIVHSIDSKRLSNVLLQDSMVSKALSVFIATVTPGLTVTVPNLLAATAVLHVHA